MQDRNQAGLMRDGAKLSQLAEPLGHFSAD
jgi:hypothetical protein